MLKLKCLIGLHDTKTSKCPVTEIEVWTCKICGKTNNPHNKKKENRFN